MNRYFQPFYQPNECGKALCVRPDVMELDELYEFPEYSRDPTMYLALRNLTLALWYTNCKVSEGRDPRAHRLGLLWKEGGCRMVGGGLRSGTLCLPTVDTGWMSVVWGGCLVPCRMFCGFPGLCPLDTRTSPVVTTDVDPRCCLLGTESPHPGNHHVETICLNF